MPASDEKAYLEDTYAPDSRQRYKAEENKRIYYLNNPNKHNVLQIKVDGLLYTDRDGMKCDYAFTSKEYETAILVELKGCDVHKAIKQLLATIIEFRSKYRYKKFYGRVVSSRNPVPFLQYPEYKKLSRLLKELDGTIIIRSQQFEETLNGEFKL